RTPLEDFPERSEAILDRAEHGSLRKPALGIALGARSSPGEELDTLLDRVDGPDREPAPRDGVGHVMAQDDVRHVRAGDHYPLASRQAVRTADLEEALDLRGRAADRLDAPELIDRARDRDLLIDRQFGERREERVELL